MEGVKETGQLLEVEGRESGIESLVFLFGNADNGKRRQTKESPPLSPCTRMIPSSQPVPSLELASSRSGRSYRGPLRTAVSRGKRLSQLLLRGRQ